MKLTNVMMDNNGKLHWSFSIEKKDGTSSATTISDENNDGKLKISDFRSNNLKQEQKIKLINAAGPFQTKANIIAQVRSQLVTQCNIIDISPSAFNKAEKIALGFDDGYPEFTLKKWQNTCGPVVGIINTIDYKESTKTDHSNYSVQVTIDGVLLTLESKAAYEAIIPTSNGYHDESSLQSTP